MELWGLIPYNSGLNGTQKDIYAQKQIYLRLRDVEVAGSNPVISTFIKLFEHFVASPEMLFFYSLLRKSMGHLVFKNLYMLYKAIVFNATIKDISLTHQYFCDIINMSIRE